VNKEATRAQYNKTMVRLLEEENQIPEASATIRQGEKAAEMGHGKEGMPQRGSVGRGSVGLWLQRQSRLFGL